MSSLPCRSQRGVSASGAGASIDGAGGHGAPGCQDHRLACFLSTRTVPSCTPHACGPISANKARAATSTCRFIPPTGTQRTAWGLREPPHNHRPQPRPLRRLAQPLDRPSAPPPKWVKTAVLAQAPWVGTTPDQASYGDIPRVLGGGGGGGDWITPCRPQTPLGLP